MWDNNDNYSFSSSLSLLDLTLTFNDASPNSKISDNINNKFTENSVPKIGIETAPPAQFVSLSETFPNHGIELPPLFPFSNDDQFMYQRDTSQSFNQQCSSNSFGFEGFNEDTSLFCA